MKISKQTLNQNNTKKFNNLVKVIYQLQDIIFFI
jgi:hypothetical protein